MIAAAREPRQVSESRRRMPGLEAPSRHHVDVIDQEAIDAELLRLADEFDLGGDHASAEEARRVVKGDPPALGR